MTDTPKKNTEGLKDTIINMLMELTMFDELMGNELSIVADYMNYFELQKGKYLFKEGDKGEYVCFIVKGTIDVFKMSDKGKRALIATLSKGCTLGEMAIIDQTNRSATVRASKDTVLLLLSRKGFDIILDKHSKIGIKILKKMTRLLSMNMRRTSSLLADYIEPF